MGHLSPYTLFPCGDTVEDINVQALFICSPKEPKAGRREQTHFMAVAMLMFFTCHFVLLSQIVVPSRAPGAWVPSASPCLLPASSQGSPGLALVKLGIGTQSGRVTRTRSQSWGRGRGRGQACCLLSLVPSTARHVWRPRLQPGLPQRKHGPWLC